MLYAVLESIFWYLAEVDSGGRRVRVPPTPFASFSFFFFFFLTMTCSFCLFVCLFVCFYLADSSNLKSTAVRNLTVLSSTANKKNHISNHFLDRWRHGYVVHLGETSRSLKLNISSLKVEKLPRHFWRIIIVTQILPIRDSEVRGAIVRITKINTILKCPVKKLFTVGNTYHDTNQTAKANEQKLRLWTLQILKF